MNPRFESRSWPVKACFLAALCSQTFAADPSPKTNYAVPMTRAAHDSPLGVKVDAECNQLYHLLLDPETMFNVEKRKQLLGTAKPLLLQYRANFRQLATDNPSMSKDADNIDDQTTERLALLGDEETLKTLRAQADGSDTAKSVKAQCVLMRNEWTLADGDKSKQSTIVDSMDRLAHAHPESEELTALLLNSANEASGPLHNRLMGLAIDVMNNPVAAKLTGQRKIREASATTAKLVGQPFVLTGKTPDGKEFSTADWKGKVVMVDFWATWCGPCKAELPTIKKLYADNHDKGFEIVGVSNDFDLNTLKTFTVDNNLPWPELVDPDAAKNHSWNPITLNCGIDGIPHCFVIDKKGNLLTADAGLAFKDVVEKAMAE